MFKKAVISAALIASAVMAGTEVDSLFNAYISDLGYLEYSEYIEGHAEKGIKLIEQGANVNGTETGEYSDNEYYLIKAVKQGHFKLALAMIENGADLSLLSVADSTSVLYNSLSSISKKEYDAQLTLIKKILKSSDDVKTLLDTGDSNGTPLSQAVTHGMMKKNWEIVDLLIETGVSFNTDKGNLGNLLKYIIRLPESNYPGINEIKTKLVNTEQALPKDLLLYVSEFPYELIDVAVRKGVDIDFSDEDGTKADFPGLEKYQKEQLKSSKDISKDFLISAGSLTVKEVEKAVKKGADINSVSENGDTPLKAAITALNVDLVKFYLENNVKVNVMSEGESDSGNEIVTAMKVTRTTADEKAKFSEIVTALVEKGVTPEGKVGYMFTPVQVLIGDNELELAKLLIKHGADPLYMHNEEMGSSFTLVLMGLIMFGSQDISDESLLFALELEGYKNSVTEGTSVLTAAVSTGRQKVIDALIEHGAEFKTDPSTDMTPLISATYADNIDMAKQIIAAGVDINASSSKGWTPLTMAANEGKTEFVAFLLDNGADVHKTFKNGGTALFLASQRGHTEIVKNLIEKGTDVNKCADNEWSPLMEAAERGYTELVSLLLDKGADSTYAMSDGQTAHSIALKNGHAETAELLK